MHRHLLPLLLTVVAVCLLAPSTFAQKYGDLPLSFEPNIGQTTADVHFLSHGKDVSVFVTGTATTLQLAHDAIQIGVAGGQAPSSIAGEQLLPGTANYLRGSDQSRWLRNLPTYARVRLANVYPGVDLVYYGNHRQLEYDFVVHPGANASPVALREKGANAAILADGSLVMRTPTAALHWHAPVAYQEINGRKISVAAAYRLEGSDIRFVLGAHDRTRDLIIDPVLVYSTYVGGNGGDVGDVGNAIATDASGNAYVVGLASSTDFPTTSAAAQTASKGDEDAFIAKLNPSGTAYLYSTYLGGGGQDIAWGVAVDAAGNAFVTGQTGSGLYSTAAFPTTAGAYQRTHNSHVLNNSVFVAKLSADGSDLLYSTLLSGTNDSTASSIAIDSNGSAYVLSNTASGFPVTGGAYQQTAGSDNCSYQQFADGQDQVVTKLDASGSTLIYSTYVGHGCDFGAAIAVDASENAYITGHTQDGAYPVTQGAAQAVIGGVVDGFVTKLNPSGSGLVYSTFIGGTMADFSTGIALDSSGYAYITGGTDGDFPTTSGAYKSSTTNNGYRKGFITKVSPLGKAWVYSTYIDGASNVEFNGIAVDKSHNAYVTGYTDGKQYPVTANAVQSTCYVSSSGCLTQAVVSKLNATGDTLLFSSYFGASGASNQYFPGNVGNAIAADGSGNFYLTGRTSNGLKTTSNAAEPSYRSNTTSTNAFVAKFNPYGSTSYATTVTILSPSNGSSVSSPVTVSAAATGGSVYELQVYVDGAKKTQVAGSVLNTQVGLTTGKHRLTVQAIDKDGTVSKSTIYVTAK